MPTATLLVTCQDRTGLVAAVSDFVFRHSGNIIEADQHSERSSGSFAMRLQFDLAGFQLDREGIGLAMELLARRFDMRWQLHYDDQRIRVAVFCSRQLHCLHDLLMRQHMGEFAGDIVLVVSNHEEGRGICEHFSVPFVHLPVAAHAKDQAEAAQRALLAEQGIACVVLARYMQVLSPDFAEEWAERMINIHHSFLPAFAGARPYHQAKERGVKIIGATAHYVTAMLDDGPIIEQDVIHVSHRDEIEDLIRKGRDIERQVLARALALHLDHRVLVVDRRTLVLR